MSATVKDLGPVTAYAYAVAGGYEGTEAEFTQLVASLRDGQEMIAEAFDSTKNYLIGEYCIYSGNLYRFTSNHSAGNWNSSHVSKVVLGEEVADLKTDSADYFATKRDLLENAGEFAEIDVSSGIEADKMVYIDTNFNPPVLKTYTAQWAYNATLDVVEGDSFKLDLYSTGSANALFYAFVDKNGGILANETFGVSSDTHITNKVITAPANAAALRFNYFGYRDMSLSKRHVKPVYSKSEIDEITGNQTIEGLDAYEATLTTGDEITLAPANIKAGYTLSFRGRISSLNSLKLEYGYNKAYAHSYIVLDDQDLVIHNHRYTDEVTTVQHGIDLDEEVSIDIKVYHDAMADIVLTSESGQYKTSAPWVACYGNVTVSVDGSLTDCHLRWSCDELKMDLWAFGDSYFDSWPLIAETLGFANFMIDGWSGRGSTDALSSLQKSLLMYKPKKILWCLGMNDADSSSAVNATWKSTLDSVISICEEKGIELILCTIPNTPTVNHSFKNWIVRNSGYRYVDVCSAVGADISTSWYPGLLGSDNVHPTNPKGRQVIAGRFMADVPEIAGNPDLRVIERSVQEIGGEVSELKTQIEVLEPTATSEDVGKALIAKTVSGGKVTEYEFGEAGGVDPSAIADAVDDWLDDHPEATTTVQDGSITRVKIADGVLDYVTPEMFGAVGDGETDDTQAVQDACDAGYAVYFSSGKTYYLASTVTIDHDCHLFGGEDATIKTATPSGGIVNNAIVVTGTLKKTTTLTTNYSTSDITDNSGNKLTLADMASIGIGDIIVITATDQYYTKIRDYYYLGATLQVVDVYDGHIYTNISMPWDISNTENVTVKVYDAPTAIIENLKFTSDLNSRGHYRYALNIMFSKNSVIRNCSVMSWDNDVQIYSCVNTIIDGLNMSHSKYSQSLSGDGYGLRIQSCTNTIIQRVVAMCGQATIVFGGGPPSIDTYIKNCELTSEAKINGLSMHDITYNTIIEDSTFDTISISGPTVVNRCRFIFNNRLPSSQGIIIIGYENPNITRVIIRDCKFDTGKVIELCPPTPQDPVEAIDAIINSVVIENCYGGYFNCAINDKVNVLSFSIGRIIMRNWVNCYRIIHKASVPIKYLEVDNCMFERENEWIQENSNTGAGNFDGIEYLNRKSNNPSYNRIWVDLQKIGGCYVMPENVPINFSSADTNAHYVVCGSNIASNIPNDYSVGSLTSNTGGAVVWSDDANFANAVSVNGSGDLVYTMPNGSNNTRYIRLKCFAYVNEASYVYIRGKVKNTGNTQDGAEFRFYQVEVNPTTGLITDRRISNTISASSAGTNIEINNESHVIFPGQIVLFAIHNRAAVIDSQTTFEDLSIKIVPLYSSESKEYEQYVGTSRNGDGSLSSIKGINYIMATPTTFDANFMADYPIV